MFYQERWLPKGVYTLIPLRDCCPHIVPTVPSKNHSSDCTNRSCRRAPSAPRPNIRGWENTRLVLKGKYNHTVLRLKKDVKLGIPKSALDFATWTFLYSTHELDLYDVFGHLSFVCFVSKLLGITIPCKLQIHHPISTPETQPQQVPTLALSSSKKESAPTLVAPLAASHRDFITGKMALPKNVCGKNMDSIYKFAAKTYTLAWTGTSFSLLKPLWKKQQMGAEGNL